MAVESNELSAGMLRLHGSVLRSLSFSPQARELRLSFQHWSGSLLSAHFRGVLEVNVSIDEYEASSAEVIDVRVEKLEDGGKQALENLGYMLYAADGRVRTYPGIPLVYFLMVGDMCLGVVCRDMELEPETRG